jgi:hypothetical protein
MAENSKAKGKGARVCSAALALAVLFGVMAVPVHAAPGETAGTARVTFAGSGYTAWVDGQPVDGGVDVAVGEDLSFTLEALEGQAVDRVSATAAREDAVGSDLWDGSIAESFAGGSGTRDDPYQIATGAQLAYLAQEVNGANSALSGAYYVLTQDIDLNGVSWTPIGFGYTGSYNYNCFSGQFDGGGHVIRHLAQTQGTTGAASGGGLFGRLSGATVENVGVADCAVETAGYAGALAARVGDASTVKNCWATGAVSGRTYVGGLAAQVLKNSLVEDCWNGTDVTYSYTTAPMVGGVAGDVETGGTVRNCWNVGQVQVTFVGTGSTSTNYYAKVGGVVGFAYQGATVENCWNGGAVGCSGVNAGYGCSLKNVFGVGGVVGAANGGTSAAYPALTVKNCANRGQVSSNVGYAGGVVGHMGDQSASVAVTVTGCCNSGTVTEDSATGNAGGIAGRAWGSSSSVTKAASVSNSYTCAAVAGEGQRGALIGYANCATVSNCYGLDDGETALPLVLEQGSAANGTAAVIDASCALLTAEELRAGAFLIALSDSAFAQDADGSNSGYPILSCEQNRSGIYGDVVELAVTQADGIYTISQVEAPVTVTVAVKAPASASREVTFVVEPSALVSSTLSVVVKDSAGQVVPAKSGVTYSLTVGESYTYTVTASGFDSCSGALTVAEDTGYAVNLRLKESLQSYQVSFRLTQEDGAALYDSGEQPITGALTVLEGADLSFYVEAREGYQVASVAIAGDGEDADVWDGVAVDTTWYRGDQTEFSITTAAQLAGLGELVRQGDPFAGKTIYLEADLDLTGGNFQPIGRVDSYSDPTSGYTGTPRISGRPFSGTFQGNGHTVTVAMSSTSYSYGMGLFGYLKGATVSDLVLAGSLRGTGRLGGFAGVAQSSTIDDCANYAAISASGSVAAGIAALTCGQTLIRGCYNGGTVTTSGTGYVAGIVAAATAGVSNDGGATAIQGVTTLKGCLNGGTVSCTFSGYANGAAGVIYTGNADLESCGNTGTVRSVATFLNGGIAGQAVLSMVNCYNTGNVRVAQDTMDRTGNSGTLCGAASDSMVVENCYDAGTLYTGSAGVHQPFGPYTGLFPNCRNNYWVGDDGDQLTPNTADQYSDRQFKKVTAQELKALFSALGDANWKEDMTGSNGGFPVPRVAPALTNFSTVKKSEDVEGLYTLSSVGRDMTLLVTLRAPLQVTVDDRTGQTAAVAAPESGWTTGENRFTVDSGQACLVVVKGEDGYQALSPEETGEESTYQFTAQLDEGGEIAVVLKGDADVDGALTREDAQSALDAGNGVGDGLSDLGQLAGDLDGDGRLSAAEARQILGAGNGWFALDW